MVLETGISWVSSILEWYTVFPACEIVLLAVIGIITVTM